MSNLIARIKKEPALAVGVVVAVLSLAAAFGLPIDDGVKSSVVGVVSAVLALLGAGVTRSKVSPVKPELRPVEESN